MSRGEVLREVLDEEFEEINSCDTFRSMDSLPETCTECSSYHICLKVLELEKEDA